MVFDPAVVVAMQYALLMTTRRRLAQLQFELVLIGERSAKDHPGWLWEGQAHRLLLTAAR